MSLDSSILTSVRLSSRRSTCRGTPRGCPYWANARFAPTNNDLKFMLHFYMQWYGVFQDELFIQHEKIVWGTPDGVHVQVTSISICQNCLFLHGDWSSPSNAHLQWRSRYFSRRYNSFSSRSKYSHGCRHPHSSQGIFLPEARCQRMAERGTNGMGSR